MAARGAKRDPYARELTNNWPNCNCLVCRADFPWHDQQFRTPDFSKFVIYQLHVGTFYAPNWPRRAGTFLDVVNKIEYFDELGITCLQLLPVVEFQTRFSLGYNCTDYFSPENDFGVPDTELDPYLAQVNRLLARKGHDPLPRRQLSGSANQLKVLVDLCHLYGLAVIFDVVYNHGGGNFDDESLFFFDRQNPGTPWDNNQSLYFTDRGHAGGLIFALWKTEVRQFLIDNANFFLDEFHADGFRYDQISVLVSENPGHGWEFCRDLRLAALSDGSNCRSWYARSRSRVALGLIGLAPGIPMIFQGQEFLEEKQWSDDLDNWSSLLISWNGLVNDQHMSDFNRFTRELLALRLNEPALTANTLNVFHVHNDNRILAFHRWVMGRDLIIVASLNEYTFNNYRLGLPSSGFWTEIFNSDVYDNWVNPQRQGNGYGVNADESPLHGFTHSAAITIPANSIIILAK